MFQRVSIRDTLSPSGLISFLGLLLRRCYLRYLYSDSTYHFIKNTILKCVCVCLSVCLFLQPSVRLSVCLLAFLLSVYVSFCLFIFLSFSVYPSVCLSVRLSVCTDEGLTLEKSAIHQIPTVKEHTVSTFVVSLSV